MQTLTKKRQVLLVGEAPSRLGDGHAFSGPSGDRLRRLIGDEAWTKIDRVNVCSLPSPARTVWRSSRVKTRARRLVREGDYRVVLLAGRTVAGLLDLGGLPFFQWILLYGRQVAVVPHPSGLSRWWNEPRNRAQASWFFRDLMSD